MASTTKRRFTDEFKREAVALWETSGRPQTEIAGELGIMPTMLRRWQRKLGDGSGCAGKPGGKAASIGAGVASGSGVLRSRGCVASWTGRGWSATY